MFYLYLYWSAGRRESLEGGAIRAFHSSGINPDLMITIDHECFLYGSFYVVKPKRSRRDEQASKEAKRERGALEKLNPLAGGGT